MSPQQQLGPYRLIERIGKGGMGEVWKAHDTRLGRDVAVKLSAERFSDRFEKEARAIAALNHPNICTLFDVGPNYLVMELIDGPTLADRIADGPIPLDEAIAIGKQITDALDAAHEKHIVHRDLKPGNIKIRPDGSVKVLDFGLAKSGTPDAQMNDDSPTMAMATQMGVILGTAAYMAPEQARGKPVDKRADIWAFGVVLCEMVTGKQPFRGEDLTDTLASVVKSDPDLSPVPRQLKRLLAKCLQKDPKKRLRDIGDAWELLDDHPAFVTAPSPSRFGVGWIAAGVMALIAAAISFVHFREKPPTAPAARFAIPPPPNTRFPGGASTFAAYPALSPDGRKLVFRPVASGGEGQLWLRQIDAVEARPLAGTEGGHAVFWSPDGKSIGFFAGGKLKRLDIAGGAALTLANVTGIAGGSWGAEDTIVFRTDAKSLSRVPASGGAITAVTTLDAKRESYQGAPWFLPDRKHFLYLSAALSGPTGTIRVGSLGSPDTKSLDQTSDGMVIYSSGHLLFLRSTTLMARPFDPDRLAFTGGAVPVAERVAAASYGASLSGTLVYLSGTGNAVTQMTWYTRDGRELGKVGAPAAYSSPALSPDAGRLAVGIGPSGSRDIWVFDLARNVSTRFTFDPGDDLNPVWSPDGSRIAFSSTRSGPRDIYWQVASGAGTAELLVDSKDQKSAEDWSRDGKFILYNTTRIGIFGVPFSGDRKPVTLLTGPFVQVDSKVSPDGHWLAYRSNESGEDEIFIQSFPPLGGKWQISSTGGTEPSWRGDGKELYYLNGTKMMAVDIKVSGTGVSAGIAAGAPHELFDLPAISQSNLRNEYVVTPDGKRFLCLMNTEAANATPLTLVQNWTAGLSQ